jgi:pimeloyl-ACP methyl ester carboxylesterase
MVTRDNLVANQLQAPWGPATSRFIEVHGSRVRVLQQGAGEPVLFLHGVGGWAEHWRVALPAVARAGFRAIACDLPGFGRSAPPGQVHYLDPPDPYYARFVRDLVERLGTGRVNLVGHSLGGAIAAVTAIRFPEIVQRLVLVAPGGFGRALTPHLRLCGLPLFQQAARVAPESLVRRFIRGDFHDPARMPGWFYEDALRYFRSGAAVEVGRVMSQLVTLRGPRRSLREAWLKRAADIPCPTLIVWGRNDRTVPMADLGLFTSIPDVRAQVIEGAGHLVMMEQPAPFLEGLVPFLKDQRPKSRATTLSTMVSTSDRTRQVAMGMNTGLPIRTSPGRWPNHRN